MTKIKKIVAIITTFTFLSTIAGPAMGATIAELQAQIADLLALITSLSSQLAALQGGTGTVTGCTISSFDRSLKTGMSGDDVKCLQIVLNSDSATQLRSSGVGSPGNETSYFGPLTNAAVIKFQEKYASEILATYGLTSGTGYVGTTTKAKLNSLLGAGVGVGEVGTAAIISLAADTPVAGQTALNAQDVIFSKIKFSAGATAYTVSKIVIARGGVSADADVSSIKLYDGSTQIGSTQALNTTTHKATFTNLSWNIPAYSVKYLTVKGSIAASTVATVGDSIRFGIYAASDITSTVTPSGTFPIWGNTRTIAGISVGNLDVDVTTAPAAATILSGATDQQIACWKFAASSTEGFNVHSIKVTHVGTAARVDLSNLILKVSGAQIGSSVAELDLSNAAAFDLSSSPLSINAGSAKTVCAYVDIGGGIWTERTVKFEITQYIDVVAYGANSGGATTITQTVGTAFVKQTGALMTIGQGGLTIALDAAENPSSQNYVKGTSNRPITAIKFSTGSREGVRLTKIRLTLTGAVTDISNITLWDGTTQIAGPASAISSYVTFGANTVGWDVSGLFDIEASQNKTLVVKADIPSGATATNEIKLSIAAASDVWADGLDSQYDLPSASITGTATGNLHTITDSGSLAVSLSADTPAAQTIVKGAVNKVLAKINLTAGSGEDILISSITVRCYVGTGTGTPCTNGTTTNVKLLKSNGSQYGSTVSTPTASASFTGNLTVAAAQTETLSVVADIPTGSGAASVHFDIPDIAGALVEDELASTGISSAADIVETGSATGKLITLGAGTVTVTAAATPGDQTMIAGASQASFVDLVFSVGTAEDVKITRIKLNSVTNNRGTTTDVAHIALYDGATRLTAKKSLTASTTENHYVVFSASDFLNLSGITITKGQQKRITVKADVPSTASSTNTIGFGIAHAGSVTFVGLSSNTTPDATVTGATTDLTGANYDAGALGDSALNLVTLAEKGTLTISTTADTPIAAIQSVSKSPTVVTGVAFHKSQFAATYEDIDIKSISVTRSGGADADFAYITLWDGSTQLGSAQSLSNGSSTFNFATEDYWRIPAGGAKYLTIKADLNGIKSPGVSGASTGDAPKLGVDTVESEGVASGVAPNGDGEQDKLGNIQYLRQSQPTIALASPTSGTYGAGTQELIRWTVSASPTGDIGWEKVVFDISGSVIITSGGASYTIGCVTGNSTCTAETDGVYMSSSTDPVATQLIATTSMQVWDVDSNTQVIATTTATAWTVDQSTSAGTARVSFVASAEQQVSIGTTKTYKLIGTVLQGSGQIGSSMLTKIASRSSTALTDVYATVAGTAGVTFVWTDRSGAGGVHSAGSADWTHDFKVSGISTPTKTLSK